MMASLLSYLLPLFASGVVGISASDDEYVRGCYFTNWAQYRQGRGKYLPSEYVPGLCTHILYAFGWVNEDFTLRAFDPADVDTSWDGIPGMYQRVNDLKKIDPELKTLLSIGGWSFGTRLFKQLAKTKDTRKTFIDSSIAFVRKHNFDGLDIDWEYPSGDKEEYSKLIQETREAFEAEAKRTGNERLLLTAAVSAGEGTIQASYDIPAIAQHFDYIFLMAYDFHGGWEQITGHNAPLYGRDGDAEWQKNWNVGLGVPPDDSSARLWAEGGMPKQKIIVGMATYGRGWSLHDPSTAEETGMGVKTRAPAKPTKYVSESGVAAYYEICEMLADGATHKWHEVQEVPYLVKGDQWFGYDDVKSIKNKMEWLKSEGYGGAFVWTLDFDDFNGQCSNGGGKRYPLISAIAEELSGKANFGTSKPTSVTQAPQITTKVVPTGGECDSTQEGFASHRSDCSQFVVCYQGTKVGSLTCPAGLHFSSSVRFCTSPQRAQCERAVTSATTTDGSVTTTGGSGGGSSKPFSCSSDGFFVDPTDCNRFYRCVAGVAHSFTCPGDLHFDQENAQCVHQGNAKC